MSATVAIEHKKPTRRLSMSGLFGNHNRKTNHKSSNKSNRKMADERKKSYEFEEIIIEEAEAFSYNVTSATTTVDTAHVLDGRQVVAVPAKVPIPKEDIARTALNREIRAKRTRKLVGGKKNDPSHRGLFDSFRSARKPTKYKYRQKETKHEKRSQFAASKSVTVDCESSVGNLATNPPNIAKVQSNSVESDSPKSDRVYVRLNSNESSPRPPMYRQASSTSHTSEDSDSIPIRKVQDLSTIKVVTNRRHPKLGAFKGDRSWISDEEGVSSGSNTPASFCITPCSNSESSASDRLQTASDYASTAPPTPADEIDDPFVVTEGYATLPRRPKKHTDRLHKQLSKSQESLLTTIVNAVTNMGSKENGVDDHPLEGASYFVTGMQKMCDEPALTGDREPVSQPGILPSDVDVVSALTIPSIEKPGGDKQRSDFTTWEGREASTLPRPRRRKVGIGAIGKLSLFSGSIFREMALAYSVKQD